MPANIYQGNMLWVGQKPWHGEGKELPQNATLDEAFRVVGFYDVAERPLFTPGLTTPIPDHKALVRADTGAYVSTVGADYGVVQFREGAEAVIRAAQEVLGANIFRTAGLLGDRGERGWLMGELGAPFKVGHGFISEIRKYILFHTGHDGFTAASLGLCNTNVVCANTVAAALAESSHSDSGKMRRTVRHTTNAAQRFQDATAALGAMIEQQKALEDAARQLAQIPFNLMQYKRTIDAVIPMPEDGKKHVKIENQRDVVLGLWNTSKGGEGVRDNAWSAYQSWTEYATHGLANPGAKKLQSAWFGRGAAIADQALAAIRSEIRA